MRSWRPLLLALDRPPQSVAVVHPGVVVVVVPGGQHPSALLPTSSPYSASFSKSLPPLSPSRLGQLAARGDDLLTVGDDAVEVFAVVGEAGPFVGPLQQRAPAGGRAGGRRPPAGRWRPPRCRPRFRTCPPRPRPSACGPGRPVRPPTPATGSPPWRPVRSCGREAPTNFNPSRSAAATWPAWRPWSASALPSVPPISAANASCASPGRRRRSARACPSPWSPWR